MYFYQRNHHNFFMFIITIIIFIHLFIFLSKWEKNPSFGFISFNFKAFCSIMGDIVPIAIAI